MEMAARTNLELTLSETAQSYTPIAIPLATAVPSSGLRSDLVKVEEATHLHIVVMEAHREKAEKYIDLNADIANISTDAFVEFARSSQARVTEARGMMFEKDIQLVEHQFRQSLFDSLSTNARDIGRLTGQLVAMSVMPVQEKPKGFWQRLFGDKG
jgi:hypothetical protein